MKRELSMALHKQSTLFEDLLNEAENELLHTKLAPPRRHGSWIPRERLHRRLDEGLARKLTLVSAPAGFGKTTLAGGWAAAKAADSSGPAVAWVALDGGDNDPVRFWRYVLAACRAFGSSLGQTSLDILQNAPQPAFETVLTIWMNEFSGLSRKAVLVLEDFHEITCRSIHDSLGFLIEHLPAALHLVILTRIDPPLPLARLRARNELNELRLADLRFTLEETRAYLSREIPFELSREAITLLAGRAEGWPAGLRLVTLALQGLQDRQEVESYLVNFTGSHRPVLEYLVADVFNAQPEEIQDFLLRTSVLDRLSGPLCDAVTGRDDSARLLDQMERANLFLAPLESGAGWYRYHALFAEAMQHYACTRLGEAELQAARRKASRWYEQRGMLAEAIESALEGQDTSRAADLIQRVVAPRLVQNEWLTLRRWMEQLPEGVLRAHPLICQPFASAILFTSDRYAAATGEKLELPLEIAEAHWRAEGREDRLGEIAAFRSLVAWLQRAWPESFACARQALDLLPENDRQWRGISLLMLGMDELLAGKTLAARQTFTAALELNEAAQNIYGTLDCLLMLAEAALQRGELGEAEDLFRQTLLRAERVPMSPAQAAIHKGRARLGQAILALERNALEEAALAAGEAAEVYFQYPEEDLLADTPIVLARAKFALGQRAEGWELLDACVSQDQGRSFLRFPRVWQIRFALVDGDLAAAQRLAPALEPVGAWITGIRREQSALARARVQLAAGAGEPQLRQAIQELEAYREDAVANGRLRSELEISLVLALACDVLGDRARSAQELSRALSQGKALGCRRIFLDEGQPLMALIKGLQPQLPAGLTAYARSLLLLFGRTPREADDRRGGLIEPLTEQERRVLRLLAEGQSNHEIAKALFISVNTVKTHVKNVYGKLEVRSRSEARQAARQLGLQEKNLV